MKLKELKKAFLDQLCATYPSEEVHSFFNILSHEYLSLSRLEIGLQPEFPVSEENKKKFETAIARLKKHEPIQYILGNTEFYGLPFRVNKYTLVPRVETEELVDWIITDLSGTSNLTSHSLLDIGTGSGCIAVSLVKNLGGIEVHALDFSEEALKIAKENASLNEVEINFYQKDILTTGKLPQNYNIIVSNPPYVRELEKKEMQSNVLDYEPASALYVEDDHPLVFYIKIAQLAKTHLKESGILYFEINEYLSEDVVRMLKTEGFSEVKVRKDLFGKNRMIKAILDA